MASGLLVHAQDDRLGRLRATCDVHERAAGPGGLVARDDERVFLIGERAEVALDEFGVRGRGVGQRRDGDALGGGAGDLDLLADLRERDRSAGGLRHLGRLRRLTAGGDREREVELLEGGVLQPSRPRNVGSSMARTRSAAAAARSVRNTDVASGASWGQPIDPSICSSMSRFISTAYSMGSSLTIGSMKPFTIILDASSSPIPWDWRWR